MLYFIERFARIYLYICFVYFFNKYMHMFFSLFSDYFFMLLLPLFYSVLDWLVSDLRNMFASQLKTSPQTLRSRGVVMEKQIYKKILRQT